MADINARLLQAIDGSAPQHKVRGQNRFEFSEGSDRTLHVKIAGKNGNPLDFEGDKFPVEDKQLQSVINELNKVKSELESIKNGTLKVKNDQLIDKIDALLAKQQSLEDKINSVMQGNAFRTQLTGSKVEKIFVFNAVAIDTTKELDSQIFDVSKFQQIHLLAQNTLNETITIRMRIDGFWVRSKDDPQGSWTLATIEPNVNYTYSLNTYKPYLFQNVINTVQFVIKAENPPTSGSVTIKILGRY